MGISFSRSFHIKLKEALRLDLQESTPLESPTQLDISLHFGTSSYILTSFLSKVFHIAFLHRKCKGVGNWGGRNASLSIIRLGAV